MSFCSRLALRLAWLQGLNHLRAGSPDRCASTASGESHLTQHQQELKQHGTAAVIQADLR